MIVHIIFIALLSFLSNIIGTISGFGVGTFMTPTLLLFLPFSQTILLVCILHWFHDIWKLIFFYYGIDWKLLITFGVPTIISGFIGALLVMPGHSAMLSSLLGIFLIGTVGMLFYIPRLVLPYNLVNGVIGGIISGFFAGIFGIRGAVRSIFLTAFDLKKATFIGTTGMISLLLDSVRFVTYLVRGLTIPSYLYWGMIIFVPISFFGAFIGQIIVKKIPQEHFRTVVLIFLLIMGIKLLLTPWF